MRQLQVGILVVACAALFAAGFFIGSDTGLDLWRVGIDLLLVDVVVMKVWPTTSVKRARAPSAP